MDELPSVTVKFDLINTGSKSMTDIVFEISILDQPNPETPNLPRQVIAGPYAVRIKFVLKPSYTMDYALRLRNIYSDCECVPTVDVLSGRSL